MLSCLAVDFSTYSMYRVVVLDGESGITVYRNQVCVAGTRLNSKDRSEYHMQTTPFTLVRSQCILPDQNTRSWKN